MPTAGRLWRVWSRQRRLRQWTTNNSFPSTLERKYWSEREYLQDAARLAAAGYHEVDDEYADASGAAAALASSTQNVYTAPNRLAGGGSAGPTNVSLPDGPLMRVLYQRQPLSAS